jgi:hypothetical protein
LFIKKLILFIAIFAWGNYNAQAQTTLSGDYIFNGNVTVNGNQYIPINKSLDLGNSTDATKRLRFQFISTDAYIDYGGALYFRGTSGSEYSYPVAGIDKNGNMTLGGWSPTDTKKTLKVNGSIYGDDGLYTGSRTDPTKQLRFQFIGTDTYVSYGGTLYFRGTSGSEYSYPVASIDKNGNVEIGLYQSTLKKRLRVNGTIIANKVQVKSNVWADYVFKDNYDLPSLNEVKLHIEENKHLPGIPSETEVKENGVNVGEMQVKLLQKIEELTLYVIQQNEKIQVLESKLSKLENK